MEILAGQIIAEKVWAIGKLTLWQDPNGEYYCQLRNRTYTHTHKVPPEKLWRWLQVVLTGQ